VKQVSGKELAKIIASHGWALRRISGSHHIFLKEGKKERIVIPVHANRPLKTGLLRSLMKIADLREEDL
jgi:predicted RNA binding protein YcfA (HicA-like mRNA interferase family)